MPRPRIKRTIEEMPKVKYFTSLDKTITSKVKLDVDEWEAIRLKNLMGLHQCKAAKKMGISQPTFHRLILSANRKIATYLCGGGCLNIVGGNYQLKESV